MSKRLVDLANDIYKGELQETSETSIPSVTFWLRANIGTLNNNLGTQYKINTSSLEPNDENGCILGDDEASIYKYLYLLNYYERQIKSFAGVGGISVISTLSSDGGTIKMIDKLQVSKMYLQFRKDTENTLKNLINKYKFSKQTAVDVVGDDIIVKKYSNGYTTEPGILYPRDLF